MNNSEQIRRGEDAKLLLDNPLLKAAFAEVKAGIIESMTRSPFGDDKTHNRLVIALQLLKQVEQSIASHVQTGMLAQVQVNDKSHLRRVVGL